MWVTYDLCLLNVVIDFSSSSQLFPLFASFALSLSSFHFYSLSLSLPFTFALSLSLLFQSDQVAIMDCQENDLDHKKKEIGRLYYSGKGFLSKLLEWPLNSWSFCALVFSDILPVKEGSEVETEAFLKHVIQICLEFIKDSNDRRNKVLDFKQPDEMLKIYDFTIPDEPQNIDQLLKDCSDCLKNQVKTGKPLLSFFNFFFLQVSSSFFKSLLLSSSLFFFLQVSFFSLQVSFSLFKSFLLSSSKSCLLSSSLSQLIFMVSAVIAFLQAFFSFNLSCLHWWKNNFCIRREQLSNRLESYQKRNAFKSVWFVV